MAELLPDLDIRLENGDLGQVFKDKINGLVEALNHNRTEFNAQVAAGDTVTQIVGLAQAEVDKATTQANLSEQYKAAAEQSAIDANNTVSGEHVHTKAQIDLGEVDNTSDADKPLSDVAQQENNTIKADITLTKQLARAGTI